MNKKAIIEAVKEVLRIALLGGLTAAVGALGTIVADFEPTSLYYIVGTLVLKALDKYVHKNENIKLKGISII